MTAAWVAGSVRARAMARRRLGAAAARSLAQSGSLGDAVDQLATTPYGHDVRPGQTLAEAQRAVAATVLWHFRVLAGWTPWEGTPILRILAAGFEIADVDDLIRSFRGDPAAPPSYQLGALGTSWPQLRSAGSLADLRGRLAVSPWSDPGEDSASAIQVGMRLSWAYRAGGLVPEAWRLGGAGLLVARERFAAHRPLVGSAAAHAEFLLGEWAVRALTLDELVRALPREAAWPLEGVEGPADLWRAESTWWRGVEDAAFRMLHGAGFEPARLVGAAAVLASDAWRVRAALEVAARGGRGLEVFDDVA
jgi:hypothetical protein